MAEYTLTYNPENQGWPSFYSYKPDFIIGMNSYLYTFHGGDFKYLEYNKNQHFKMMACCDVDKMKMSAGGG